VVLFEAGKLGNPNYPKLHFVLAILNGQLGANFKLAKHCPKPDAGFGDVQGVGEVTVGAGTVTAGDSHRQHRLGSAITTFVIHFNSLLDLPAAKLTEAILYYFKAPANSPNGRGSPS